MTEDYPMYVDGECQCAKPIESESSNGRGGNAYTWGELYDMFNDLMYG
jgi:hypothetical protein